MAASNLRLKYIGSLLRHQTLGMPSLHSGKMFKGIGSTCILFLKNGMKKFCRKNYKNHLRRNNYEVCTAVARCFPNDP
jgi:hypothetical protein